MVNSTRKPSIWSRKRIEQLIELYHDQDCLWNPYSEHYKNKTKRSRAIETICNALEISKPEFAKKIHNLRNQFNTEFKKYERRLEEAEEDENGAGIEYRCRWVYFESLMFLKNVIAPRPSFPGPDIKKTRLCESNIDDDPLAKFKKKNNNDAVDLDDVTEYHIEASSVNEDEFDDFEQEHDGPENFKHSNNLTKNESRDFVSLATINKTSPTKYFTNVSPTLHMPSQETKKLSTSAVIELTAHNSTATGQLLPGKHIMPPSISETNLKNSSELRDQWSAFGEFIANEMRNYNSDISRRKLKRKIMKAMLEVGEEDEILSTSKTNLNL